LTRGKSIVSVAPYDRSGSLIRLPDLVYEWRPNTPFRVSLTMCKQQPPGREAFVLWEDIDGHRYPMSFSSLRDVAKHSTISVGVTIGWWTVTKSGKSYGICPLSVDPVARS